MSVSHIRKEILRFLEDKGPGVLCIRGNWGTGKTHTWNEQLKTAADGRTLTGRGYSNVSLFGLNSLIALKQEIIQQVQPIDRIGKKFEFTSPKSYINSGIGVVLKGVELFESVFSNNYSAVGVSAAYMMVRDILVCIDDLERKGEGLPIADVLGLVSQLREERGCKVVLLLNDEQLRDKPEFELYLEKVVDINLKFAPTPMECAAVAIDKSGCRPDVKELVREYSVRLGVDNIRVVQKALKISEHIGSSLQDFRPEVMRNVVASLVLFVCSYYRWHSAPPLSHIGNKGLYDGMLEDEKTSEDAKRWNEKLREYGYVYTDEFDLVLLKAVQDGYFDVESVKTHATNLNKRQQGSDASEALRKAWDTYHSTFKMEMEPTLDLFEKCFAEHEEFFTFGQVLSIIELFRELRQVDRSNALFESFSKRHGGNASAYDVENLGRFGQKVPDDLQARIDKLVSLAAPDPSIDELFLNLAEKGMHSETAERLTAVPVEEYVRVISSYEGPQLQEIRRGLCLYANVSNPNDSAIAIMLKAAAALDRIAEKDILSKQKASAWGVVRWRDQNYPKAPKEAVQGDVPTPPEAK